MQLDLAFLHAAPEQKAVPTIDASARAAALEILARIIAKTLQTLPRQEESGDE